jgi:hypothetical protein
MPSVWRGRFLRVLGFLSTLGLVVGVTLLITAVFISSRADRAAVLEVSQWGWRVAGICWAVGMLIEWPQSCPKGHTDIGFYYGRWSCRTCYRQENQKWRRRAKKARQP